MIRYRRFDSPRRTEDWVEEDYAAQIARDVMDEVSNLEGEVGDLDLLKELLLQNSPSFSAEGSAEVSAAARKVLYNEQEEVEREGRRGAAGDAARSTAGP